MRQYSELMVKYLARAYRMGNGWSRIAQAIQPYVGEDSLDIGSGLGFLANELPYEMTLIERDELAFHYLETHHPTRVHPLKGDAHLLQPSKRYGDVICANFGSLLEDLVLAKKWGGRNLVMLVRNQERGKERTNPATRTRLLLRSLSIPWKEEELCVDMGQPLKDARELEEFQNLYGHELSAQVEKREGEYPFWLPILRPYSLFVLSIPSIPDLVHKSTMLVEGEQGIGKSTLVGKIAKSADGGFESKRVGDSIYLNPLGGRKYDEGHKVGVCHRGGDARRFDTLGVRYLERPCTLRVMDELGFLERDALLFQKKVLDAVDDEIPTIAVIKPMHVPMLDAIRSSHSAFLLRLTVENRGYWAEEMERAIGNIPQWPLMARLSGR